MLTPIPPRAAPCRPMPPPPPADPPADGESAARYPHLLLLAPIPHPLSLALPWEHFTSWEDFMSLNIIEHFIIFDGISHHE